MKIFIDIGHPAHVHYFKNLIKKLKMNGHKIVVTARNKSVIIDLLKANKIGFIDRGEGGNSLLGKFFYILKADFILLKAALSFRPDVFLSFTTPYPAHVSFLMRKPNIAVNDTEHVDKINSFLTHPFCSVIFTPKSYLNDLGRKQIKFDNVMEGFYLHPKYFQPNKKNLKKLNLEKDDKYVILRFVSWEAHHDIGHAGLSYENKIKIIDILSKRYRLFISSESKLPPALKKYEIAIEPEDMHDVLAYAELFVGESATMVSECALLGTPAVYVNSLPLMGYLNLEEKNGLIKHFSSSKNVPEYITELIDRDHYKDEIYIKSVKMQKNFIDPTEMLYSFITNINDNENIKN